MFDFLDGVIDFGEEVILLFFGEYFIGVECKFVGEVCFKKVLDNGCIREFFIVLGRFELLEFIGVEVILILLEIEWLGGFERFRLFLFENLMYIL